MMTPTTSPYHLRPPPPTLPPLCHPHLAQTLRPPSHTRVRLTRTNHFRTYPHPSSHSGCLIQHSRKGLWSFIPRWASWPSPPFLGTSYTTHARRDPNLAT